MPKKVVRPPKKVPNLEAELLKEIATLKKKITHLEDKYLKIEDMCIELQNKYSVLCDELAMFKKPQDLLSDRPTPDGYFETVVASDKK